MLLPVAWTLFALSAVGGFLMIAAYWLDLQERSDLRRSRRIAWALGIFAFPVTIPLYAFFADAGWPVFLRGAAFVPLVAVVLLVGFIRGVFG